MHDIWNPWHGCVHISPGCANCYMYTLDQQRGKSGADIYRTNNFNYPLQRDRYGNYKIKSGELIRVCMTSDFFLEEAEQEKSLPLGRGSYCAFNARLHPQKARSLFYNVVSDSTRFSAQNADPIFSCSIWKYI